MMRVNERLPEERIALMEGYFMGLRNEWEHDPFYVETLWHVLVGYNAAWNEIERLREQLAAGVEAAQLAIEQLEQTSEILRTLKQNNPIMAQARRYIADLQGPEASES